MVARYFDIPTYAEGIATGFNSFLNRRLIVDAEHKRKAAEKKARRKKLLIAAASGVGALALGPALGLAGTAGAAGAVPAGTAAGTAVGLGSAVPLVGATAGTAGLLGTGGIVGLGGVLTGAAIGAQAGSAFGEGDIAGGFSSLASPFVAQQARQMKLEDRATERAANLSDALTLDEARTSGNIRQAQAASEIAQYGMPLADYMAENQAPDAPDSMPLGMGPPAPYDPVNDPYVEGPSSVPGMDKRYIGSANVRRSRIAQRRQDTVDSPAWRNGKSDAFINAERQAIAREEASIKTTLMPHQPTMQERVQQGTWTDPKTGIIYHDKSVSPTLPSKALRPGEVPWTTPEERDSHFEANHIGPIDPNAEYIWDGNSWNKETTTGGGSGDNLDKVVGDIQKAYGDEGEPASPETVNKVLIQRENAKQKAENRKKNTDQLMANLQSLEKMKNAGLPVKDSLKALANEAKRIYGNPEDMPVELVQMIKSLAK